jgi:hypothetical protein
LITATLLAAGPAAAAEGEKPAPSNEDLSLSRALVVMKGSSILVEHAASVGHLGDLSPGASVTRSRSLVGSLAFQISEKFSLAVGLGAVQELTPTDTTLPRELLFDDLQVDLSYSLPAPPSGPLSWGVGFGIDAPTSKASKSASLRLALRPSIDVAITAPVLDGLSFTYAFTPAPRLHRYTTASSLVPYPCSPAAGCASGLTTDFGSRNTALQLAQDFSLSISALADRLSVTASFGLLHSKRYAKSASARWTEATLLNEANGGGDPLELSSTFGLDVSFRLHPTFGLSAGLWTPGGLGPTGAYYNPIANRHSQVYFDLVFYPIDAWLLQRQANRKTEPSK